MNALHKAYAVLGLDAGSSMDSVLRRYKRLIMVWHPDRAPTPEHKEFAEEELKKINNAKDLLSKHFDTGGGHKASGCDCQPSAGAAAGSTGTDTGSRTGPGPGPAYHRTKSQEEKQQEDADAKKRDAERKARKAAEEAAKQSQQQTSYTTNTHSMESAVEQQRALQDEKLRWKISIGLVIGFIALELFGAGAINAKNWWHDQTWKWQNQSTNNNPPSSSTTGNTAPPPYIPAYEQTPGGNPTTWAAEQAQRDKERKEQEKKKNDQDIYFAKLDIDKYEKIIKHCNSELTNLELKIADPSISDYEKNKLREMRDFRQKNLAEAQENLVYARKKLADLTGQSLPTNLGFPVNTSPFAAPAAPGLNSETSIQKPLFDRPYGLGAPSSSNSNLSDLMKKYRSESPSSTPFSGKTLFERPN